jgi:hypothetical protein
METLTIRRQTLVAFAAGVTITVVVALLFAQAWQVGAAPGDTDSTFVPTAPCRLVDTRPEPDRVGTTGAFGADASKTILAHGTNGNCTLPTDAVAVSLNVTAIGATEPSFLTFWPEGERPIASSLNPLPDQPPTPNAVTTTLSETGGFNVYNKAGSVDIIIDVNGYYTQDSLAQLAADVAALQAGQPFIVDSDPIESVEALSTITEIRHVTVTAPVDGQVAVIASAYMVEGTNGYIVKCGLMESVDEPGDSEKLFWQGQTEGAYAHLSANRVFDISAQTTATYYLVCRNVNSSSTQVNSPKVTGIFTPAP